MVARMHGENIVKLGVCVCVVQLILRKQIETKGIPPSIRKHINQFVSEHLQS